MGTTDQDDQKKDLDKSKQGDDKKDDQQVDPKIAEIMKDPDAVANLLKAKRDANAEAKKYRESLEKIQKDRQDADSKALEEQGKFKELNEKLKAEKADIEAKFKARLVTAALVNEAIAQGIVDQEAVALAKKDGVKVGDDYTVEGAKEAIEAFKKEKPHFFKTDDETTPPPDGGGKKAAIRGKVEGNVDSMTPIQKIQAGLDKAKLKK